MLNKDRCEVCGGVLEFRIINSTQGLFCKSCDWSLVTTYISEIELDENDYFIHIINVNLKNKNHIRLVSKISGLNYVEVCKLDIVNKPVIFKGKASAVKKNKDILVNGGIMFEIDPPFNY